MGTRFHYFNQGYSVLARVVEVVSGQTYGDYIEDHIFAPLGMTRSFTDRDQAEAAGLAQGHIKLFGFPLARDLPHTEHALGYGHLTSTARDLGRFGLAIAADGTLDDATLLSPASVELMRTAPVDVPDTVYGLGWSVWESDGGDRTTSQSPVPMDTSPSAQPDTRRPPGGPRLPGNRRYHILSGRHDRARHPPRSVPPHLKKGSSSREASRS